MTLSVDARAYLVTILSLRIAVCIGSWERKHLIAIHETVKRQLNGARIEYSDFHKGHFAHKRKMSYLKRPHALDKIR